MTISVINHTTIGKTSHDAGYIHKAANYYFRKNACMIVKTVGDMPASKNGFINYMEGHAKTLRANGRICDRFHMPLPRGITPNQGADLLHKWVLDMGGDSARSYIFIHVDNWEHNPHGHVVWLDNEEKTRRRIQRTSERGSSARIKREWQKSANTLLEQWGVDLLDFDAAEAKAAERRAHEVTNDNIDISKTTDIVNVGAENDNVKEEPVVDYQLEDKPIAEEAARLANLIRDYQYICKTREEYAKAKREHDHLKSIYENEKNEAFEMRAIAIALEKDTFEAKEALKAYTKDNGKLKGFSVGAFGLKYESPARKEALTHQAEVEQSAFKLMFARENMMRTDNWLENTQQTIEQVEGRLTDYEHLLSVYGNTKEAETAENAYQASADIGTLTIDKEHLKEAADRGEVQEEDLKTIREHVYEMEARMIDEPENEVDRKEEIRFKRAEEIHQAFNDGEIEEDEYDKLIDELEEEKEKGFDITD